MEQANKDFKIEDYSINQNLFIEASAGTGKTYTIELLTAKLVESGVPLSKILIVTYTEKATGELRDRIRQKMEKCLAEKLKNGKDASAFRKAMQDVHSAPIFTIHSFCQNTLRSFAYEAKAPLSLDVVADEGIMSLIEKYIRDDWANDETFKELLSQQDFDIEGFKEECKNAVTRLALADNIQLRTVQYKCFDDLMANLPHFKENFDILEKNRDLVNPKKKVLSDFVQALQNWTSGKLFNGKSFSSSTWRNNWASDEINSAMEYFFNLHDNFGGSNESPNDSQVFILNHAHKIRNEWEAYKKESKLQSYDNMIQSVREAVLQKDSDLAKRLRETYRVAIIDEFQDTNQKQWDIFSTVFQKSNGKCNIIVVGDPKQSIYSFQGADLKVYTKAIGTFNLENGKELQINNRSTDDLIKACNEIFKEDFFTEQNFSPSDVPPSERKKLPATLNGTATRPLWIADNEEHHGVDEKTFAQYAVTKILECCKVGFDDHTALQVYDKDQKKMVDVRFSDFAILARSRSEMAEIEKVMASVGIPFTRYKDSNLFKGREPLQWIAILEAIDAPDFSGYRKNLFNQALFSDFFRISVDDMAQKDYSNPQQEPMSLFIKWKKLARNRKWAELQESIYQDTRIDEYLSKPKSLQTMAKIRQIGSYIFDYLYNNRVSLEEAIKHLKGISSFTESTDDADGNLVAKDGDFDAVQVMTIHASKGLAFPIVIVPGGNKGYYEQAKGPFIYESDNQKHLGFDSVSKAAYKKELFMEWQRLIYVAYTRAQSLMILPRYKRSSRGANPFAFMDQRINTIKDSDFARTENYSEADWDFKKAKQDAAEILKAFSKPETESVAAKDQQQDAIVDLQDSLGGLSIFQYSYTSLATKKKAKEAKIQRNTEENNDVPEQEITDSDGSRNDKDESTGANNPMTVSIDIDSADNIVAPCSNYVKEAPVRKLANYPRGSKLGNALHETFEHADFIRFGSLSREEAVNDCETRTLIEERFSGQSFAIARHQDWVDFTASHVWNTLNAELPEIHGSSATGKMFFLKELPESDRKHEMEFRLNAQFKEWLNRFCKGFMDLLFVRHDEDTGRDYYSVLDWKSDVLEDEGYASKDAVADKVTEEYSVQRVLYSYCLIQWLKQFYGPDTEENLSDEEIFKKHFGGIYYAFARGCEAGTCNGIYAQTWKDYKSLQESYSHIISLMGR